MPKQKEKKIMSKNFYRYDGLTGCVKIRTNYSKNSQGLDGVTEKTLPGSLHPPPFHTHTVCVKMVRNLSVRLYISKIWDPKENCTEDLRHGEGNEVLY